MTNEEPEVVNREEAHYLSSDLVYPLESGYVYAGKLDEKWVKGRLRMSGIVDIKNKYCVVLGQGDRRILITNHDGTYNLTVKS